MGVALGKRGVRMDGVWIWCELPWINTVEAGAERGLEIHVWLNRSLFEAGASVLITTAISLAKVTSKVVIVNLRRCFNCLCRRVFSHVRELALICRKRTSVLLKELARLRMTSFVEGKMLRLSHLNSWTFVRRGKGGDVESCALYRAGETWSGETLNQITRCSDLAIKVTTGQRNPGRRRKLQQ